MAWSLLRFRNSRTWLRWGFETDLRSVSGSAAILSEKDLEAFDYVDLGKLLSTVPGVYVRGEDGFGPSP